MTLGTRVGTGTDIHWRSINAIRFLSVDAVQKAASGHPGAPMGAAPVAYVLWTRFLRHNPSNPNWANRDRFLLSAGHASMLLYSLLHLTGYDVPLDELKQFRQWGSITPGHPEHGLTPGVEATTGPLGQGFANGVGMAIAERLLASSYNRPGHDLIDHRTFALCSDGDLMEGIASEAASLAGTLELGKIAYLYDDNEISIEGETDLAFRESVPERFDSYGWHVVGPVDGNDLDALEQAIGEGVNETGKPSLVVVKTVIGYGSPNKAGTASAHGEPLGEDEVAGAREALGWDYPPFEVPGDVTEFMATALKRGASLESAWEDSLSEYESDFPDLAAALRRDLAGELPDGWDSGLDELIGSHDESVATRAVSGKSLAAITASVPSLVGGSADLAPSNNSTVAGRGDFSPENPDGRTLHFGVREHAMGAIANGIALHRGFVPYAASFLIFSDYMRASIRLGALSHCRVIWVYTHDSVGVGEDGPTHEPISQLMGLRMIPNLTVLRPADGDETVEAWRTAMNIRNGPVALILTRQALPQLPDVGATVPAKDNFARGAYVVRDSDSTPDLIIIGTGSEVQHALVGARMLEQDGVAVRVVSMPSWELFESQPEAYRESVLPSSVRARVAIEAGGKIGWERYTGLDGAIIGMDGYGASAPGGTNMKEFGFTAENVVETGRRLLKDRS